MLVFFENDLLSFSILDVLELKQQDVYMLASYILVFAVFGKEPTSFNLLVEILPLIGMGVMTVGLSMKDSKAIRVCGFINSPCWLIYNSLVFSSAEYFARCSE